MQRVWCVLAAATLGSGLSLADTVSWSGYNNTVLGTGTMQAFPAPLNESGAAYWENPSRDGIQMNIGNWLTGTGGFSSINNSLQNSECAYGVNPCIGNSPGISASQLDWVGNPSNGSEMSSQAQLIEFQQTLPATQVTIKALISSYTSMTELGWYDVNTGLFHRLFDGAGIAGPRGSDLTLGATASFSSSGSYYFYMINYALGTTYVMDSTKNDNGEAGRQHFSVFARNGATPDGFYVGVEDAYTDFAQGPPASWNPNLAEHLGDDNDVIFSVTPVGGSDPILTPEPEPSVVSLCGFGLLGLCGLALRRRRARSLLPLQAERPHSLM